ncbi:MAG: hypothetical protein LUG27_04400, partial [Clostridiales bacterium]|nr:hypothetical protein [Clostridiales bacterium]
MNAIIFFMDKRFISVILAIVISFTAFISAPVSVYASVGGYSWEDYYDLDSDGNYTFNDAFYNLSIKGKIYVILDTLQNADDKVSTEYMMEDDTAVNVLSYIAWCVLTANGIVADFVSNMDMSSEIVSTFINLFDSGDVSLSSDGITVSSDAVNSIRQAYVDQYRIVEIDDYNVFSFGTVFNTDAVYSDVTTVYTENIDTYAYRWNTLASDEAGNEFVCVPVVYYNNALYYGYEYATSSLKFYIAKNGNTTGKWHIAQYCDGSLGNSSVSGRLYYDADSVQTSAEIVDRYSLSNSAPAAIYFIQDTNESDSLPYASETGYIGYDSSTGYYYWSVNNPVYRISDVNFISRLLAFGSFDTTYAPAYSPDDAQTTVAYVPYVSYMDSAFYEGSEQNKAKIVQLSMDSVLVDDISGTTYTYNTSGGGHYVSSDAIDDATDGDNSNSPSKVINYNTVVYVVNNYDNIIEEITEDDSVANVTEVVNNYYESETDYDFNDDDGSGSTSGSDDDSDDGSIIAWLIKIYNKLCNFYTDAMNTLSSIRSSLVSLKTYAYMMVEDISDLNSLVDSLPNYNSTLQPISEQVAAIKTMVVSVNTNLNNGLDELYDLLDTIHADLSDLYSLVDELPDYSTTLSPISEHVASIKSMVVTINTNLNNGLSDLYDLVASLPDYSSVLSTVSSTVSSINTSVSSLGTKLTSALDYLDDLSDGVATISSDLHSFVGNYSGSSGGSSDSGSSSGSSSGSTDYSSVLGSIYEML